MLKIPTSHDGLFYMNILSDLSRNRNFQRYMEIGVDTGQAFSCIFCDTGIAVDPAFKIQHNIMQGKKRVSLFQMESDAFFRDVDVIKEFGGPVDFAFLDGMHRYEYLLRDFHNAEKICAPQSLIAMHDCLPLNAAMAHRDQATAVELGKNTPYRNYWTGDVWKIIPILKKYRPDLKLILTHTPPTGLVFVSNLDPESMVLSDNYDQILQEFNAAPNDMDAIAALYAENKITGSATY